VREPCAAPLPKKLAAAAFRLGSIEGRVPIVETAIGFYVIPLHDPDGWMLALRLCPNKHSQKPFDAASRRLPTE